MNSDDLDLFSRVAKTRSISRAATETGTNQSTVSRRIALLESRHGVRFFRRSGRGMELTEHGELLLGYALQVEQLLEEASLKIRNSSESGPGKICIAAQPTIAWIMFGGLAHAIKSRYPKIQVRFIEGLASQILSALHEGDIDIAVMYVPERHGMLQYDLLLQEGIDLITPVDYPLHGESIDVRTLGKVPLILPSTHHGLRLLVESLATRHGFTPSITLECDGSISILKRLVLANCGCTVLPAAAVIDEVAAGRLKRFQIESPRVAREVGIVWSQGLAKSEDLWHVSQIIRRCASDLVRNGEWPGAVLAPKHSDTQSPGVG